MTTGDKKRPIVWLITDNKPGHKNQLKGLADRLGARARMRFLWIETRQYPVSWCQAILGQAPEIGQSSPDIMVAAGSRAQKLLLACRKRYHAMTVVLMRPALPFAKPDLSIIPAHDNPPDRQDVLATRGALNAITPQRQTVEAHKSLILLGGPSGHFEWDNDDILRQVNILAGEYPDWHWKVTSSRRTPTDLLEKLNRLHHDNMIFYHHEQTGPDWLSETLAETRATWVSPDSVSMVYEALTAGTLTGLLHLRPRHNSRVVRGLESLKTDGFVSEWKERAQLMQKEANQSQPLWEADRAAKWLIEKFREFPR